MAKKLTKANIILFAIAVVVALIYAIYECNDYLIAHLKEVSADKTGMLKPNVAYLITTFHYLLFFSALLAAGFYWGKEQHYPNVYFFAVKCTFLYPAATFIFSILSYNPDYVREHTGVWDCFVVPAFMLVIAVIASVNYFLCHREAKDIYEDF